MSEEIKRFFMGAEEGDYCEIPVNIPADFFSEEEEGVMMVCGMGNFLSSADRKRAEAVIARKRSNFQT